MESGQLASDLRIQVHLEEEERGGEGRRRGEEERGGGEGKRRGEEERGEEPNNFMN